MEREARRAGTSIISLFALSPSLSLSFSRRANARKLVILSRLGAPFLDAMTIYVCTCSAHIYGCGESEREVTRPWAGHVQLYTSSAFARAGLYGVMRYRDGGEVEQSKSDD